MSLTALPVLATDLTTLQAGVQFFTNTGQATSEAAAINAPGSTQSVFTYAASLINSNISLSQVTMAVSAIAESGTIAVGDTATPNTLTFLSTQFLPAQVAFAAANGLNQTVFAAESLGLALAGTSGFQTDWAGLSGSAFVTSVAGATGVNASAIQGFLTNWLAFYTANGVPGGGLTITQAAYGATLGDAIGVALLNPTSANLQSVFSTTGANNFSPNAGSGLVQNALIDVATGQYVTGVSLGALPQHTALQGQGAGPGAGVFLTQGIDSPGSGFADNASGTPLLNGFTATTAGQVFTALPFVTPFGLANNTLNTGDDLEATGAAAGTAILNYSTTSGFLDAANPIFATGVTMNGVGEADITNNSFFGTAGFTGSITGLTTAVLEAGSVGRVQLGLDTQGLNTALANVTVNASHDFTAWMTNAAFGTGTDAVTVTLGGVDTTVTLNDTTVGPTTTLGYGTITVASGGGQANSLELDTNATTTSSIVVTGAQNLDIFSDQVDGRGAMNIANLKTFDASAATGNVLAWFFGRGTGALTATGGSGNDTFVFGSVDRTANFTAADKVDGGTGTNTLSIEVETGAILLAGVGSNITNIHTIEQVSGDQFGNVTGDTSADMSLAGSATTLALDANYSNGVDHNVTVTNLTTAMTVTYGGTGPDDTSTGSNLGTLTLSHATPIGILDTINFTMNSSSSPAALTVDALVVALTSPNIAALNIDSTGNATDNVITDVSGVADNVAISGGTHLTFGSAGGAYDFLHGIIDAHTDTGGVEAWLGRIGSTGTGVAAQTFVGGSGNDLVHAANFGGTVVDFTAGGKDAVEFREANFTPTNPLNDTAHNYNQVLGWTTANDTLDIHNNASLGLFGAVNFTNGTGAVPAGAAVDVLDFTTGANVSGTGSPFDYIKIDTPTSGAGQTAQQGFNSAMGLLGSINVVGSHEYLVSYYDLQDSQAVFETVHSGATLITAGDHVSVVGLLHMSQADYASLSASNLHFT